MQQYRQIKNIQSKPRQWGPITSVSTRAGAIARDLFNAGTYGVFPFWRGRGLPVNYANKLEFQPLRAYTDANEVPYCNDGINCNNTYRKFYLQDSTGTTRLNYSGSMFTKLKRVGTSTSTYQVLFYLRDGTTSSRIGVMFNGGAGICLSHGADFVINPSYTMPSGEDIVLAINYSESSVDLYINGEFYYQAVGSTWSDGGSGLNRYGLFDIDGSTSYCFNQCEVYGLYHLDQQLTTEQMKYVADYPNILIQQPSERIFTFGSSVVELAIANCNHSVTSSVPTLTQVHNLLINNGFSAHSAVNVILNQIHALSIDSSTHVVVSDNLSLEQNHNLSINSTTHDQIVDNIALTQNHSISIASATHIQIAEALALSQNHLLSINNATHLHNAENVTLSLDEIIELEIQSAAHGMTSTSMALSQIHQLLINQASHAVTSNNITLYQIHELLINSGFSYHVATNVVLDIATILEIQSSYHEVITDTCNITQNHLLNIMNAVSSHYSDEIILTQNHLLIISDALHDLISTSPELYDETTIIQTPDDRIFVIQAQDRVFIIAKQERVFNVKTR